jgi:hypothetical protein
MNNYYSRTYDPTTGLWMSQDSWRGLLERPQTLARYGYVSNSPIHFQDVGGFRISDPSADTDYHSPTFWIKQQQQAATRASEVQSVRNAYESARGLPSTDSTSDYTDCDCGYSPASDDSAITQLHQWTDKPGKVAQGWGIPVKEVKSAIEDLKQDGGKFGGSRNNPDVEIDLGSGDVRIKGGDGEPIGNLED